MQLLGNNQLLGGNSSSASSHHPTVDYFSIAAFPYVFYSLLSDKEYLRTVCFDDNLPLRFVQLSRFNHRR